MIGLEIASLVRWELQRAPRRWGISFPACLVAKLLMHATLHKGTLSVLSSTPDALFYPWFKSSQTCDVIALAASAGGFEALAQLLSGLPDDFTVPIIALLHRGKRPPGPDVLVEFLSQRSRLRVVQVQPGEKLEPKTIHVLPHTRDMRLQAGCFQVCSSTSRFHPSADVLFESLAEEYGPRCIGVVLSGAQTDGARGVSAIRARGGTVLVQAPETAIVRGMPRTAIQTGFADGIMHPTDIAHALISLTLGRRRAPSLCHPAQI